MMEWDRTETPPGTNATTFGSRRGSSSFLCDVGAFEAQRMDTHLLPPASETRELARRQATKRRSEELRMPQFLRVLD